MIQARGNPSGRWPVYDDGDGKRATGEGRSALLRAQQFLALVTAETNMRHYQQNPEPLEIAEIRQLVVNAVDMFLRGGVR